MGSGFLASAARISLGVLVGVVLLGIAACALQRRFIYQPERETEAVALERAGRLGLAPWRDAAGKLRGWRASPPGPPRARVLVLHGNGGSALGREVYAAALVPRGCAVAVLEYPGYGSRPGDPSEETLSAAAVEAVDALAAEGPEPLWLLGESLGSGVAARAARLRPEKVAAVLLVVPFARISEVAGFPLVDRWAPLDDLAGWKRPVAVVIAGRDEVVSPEQGRKLFEALPGPKRLWEQPWATHNGLNRQPDQPWWGEVIAFLETGK